MNKAFELQESIIQTYAEKISRKASYEYSHLSVQETQINVGRYPVELDDEDIEVRRREGE